MKDDQPTQRKGGVQLTDYQIRLIDNWMKTHDKNSRAPIYADPNNPDKAVWINRQRRRTQESLERRAKRHQDIIQNADERALEKLRTGAPLGRRDRRVLDRIQKEKQLRESNFVTELRESITAETTGANKA